MLQSKYTLLLLPSSYDTFGPYSYRYEPITIPTGARWNGATGSVMELLSVRFVWDFNNQFVTNPGAGIAKFGYQTGGQMNRPDPEGTAVGPQQAEMTFSAGLRQADKSPLTTNTARWPDERLDAAWLAVTKKGTLIVFSRSTTTERFVFNTQHFERDTLWNYNDGLGNGLRVNSEHLTLHTRVDWKDTISFANDSNKILEPPNSTEAQGIDCPPQYIHVYLTYKYREVDVYEWQRLTATHHAVDTK